MCMHAQVVHRPQGAGEEDSTAGLDAQKADVAAGKAVAQILRTSLGPKSMDKMLQSPDGDATISKRPLTPSLVLPCLAYLLLLGGLLPYDLDIATVALKISVFAEIEMHV
ncbi:hypothetical protein GUJ93_ZPchr0012g19749 [Zizania palustris]|uniref:Uncharacterized protein n=1 Tax=Zizania palustris TaxID=103762 RepID=A0A8J5WPT4_ZIZPA|nr:hypothetical protein GUJ93_ZPchr0012g19749 [Zizania palustris]